MTVPPTDRERAAAPAAAPAAGPPTPSAGPPTPAAGPVGLPQRASSRAVRQRNRVSYDVLAATFAGLQQIDDKARPTAPAAPPADLWPPVTGAHPRVTG